jgi:hypothetical protein
MREKQNNDPVVLAAISIIAVLAWVFVVMVVFAYLAPSTAEAAETVKRNCQCCCCPAQLRPDIPQQIAIPARLRAAPSYHEGLRQKYPLLTKKDLLCVCGFCCCYYGCK